VADELAKLSSSRGTVPLGVFMQELHEPSNSKALSKPSKTVESIEDATLPNGNKLKSSDVTMVHSNWCTLFMIYLKTYDIPKDKDKRVRLRSASGALLQCIPTGEGYYILQDIHSGICGSHAGVRTLVGKAYR
jgi:hypothetical protein